MSKDGGPAFPQQGTYIEDGQEVYIAGMTMRQYYKAAALTGLMERAWDDIGDGKAIISAWVRAAASVADAMLREDEEHADMGGSDE